MLFDLNVSMDVEAIQIRLRYARAERQRIGLTSGSFDSIHFHHFLYLNRCRRSCDILFVGVDSDELVRERKGEGRPLVYDLRRAVMVDALKPVAFTFILNSVADFGLAAKIITPDVIFKNDTFLGRESEVVGKEHAREIRIVRDVVDHASTTQMLEEAARIAMSRKSS